MAKDAQPFMYWKGFPSRHRLGYGRRMALNVGMLVVFALLPAVGGAVGLWLFLTTMDRSLLLFSAGLFVVALTGGFLFRGAWGNWHVCAIVPYFERRRTGGGSGRSGYREQMPPGSALARNCQRLDELALSNGTKPLSFFGFDDDLVGEVLHWHDAAEGLATIEGLLKAVASKHSEFPDSDAIVEDLQDMRFYLKDAASARIRFCFLLREGVGRSGHEDAVRKGCLW